MFDPVPWQSWAWGSFSGPGLSFLPSSIFSKPVFGVTTLWYTFSHLSWRIGEVTYSYNYGDDTVLNRNLQFSPWKRLNCRMPCGADWLVDVCRHSRRFLDHVVTKLLPRLSSRAWVCSSTWLWEEGLPWYLCLWRTLKPHEAWLAAYLHVYHLVSSLLPNYKYILSQRTQTQLRMFRIMEPLSVFPIFALSFF